LKERFRSIAAAVVVRHGRVVDQDAANGEFGRAAHVHLARAAKVRESFAVLVVNNGIVLE
jgi:hypothetical protein